MLIPKSKPSAADAISGLSTVALISFVVAMLYFAREILIPLTLAALITFLLAPMVTRIERWLGRIIAVLLVVTIIFASTIATGWMLSRQVIELAAKLPDYKDNIVTKLHIFKKPEGPAFKEFTKAVEELKQELPGATTEAPTIAPDIAPKSTPKTGQRKPAAAPEPVLKPPVVPVQIVDTKLANPIEVIRSLIATALGPLGVGALVLLLVIFMLLQREKLRNRLIRLIGQGHISATSRAMGDASRRVSRYLFMQLVVNVTYGIPVAIGLFFIGVPNAILWGCFAALLRFIPYLGPWIAAIIPVAISLAVSPGWMMPLLTISLFVVLELISNNVIEPWLYGSSTGISSIALIVSAVFWTWLWGPVGLVLATPLTVCLVVMGRHVPRLSFLSVLLSDEEALTPAEDFYHRLLTPGENDEIELVEIFLKQNSPCALYDSVFMPVIVGAEMDFRKNSIAEDHLALLRQNMGDLIRDLGTRPPSGRIVESIETPETLPMPPCRVCCLPARADRDELAAAMLVNLLQQESIEAWSAPKTLVAGELMNLLDEAEADVVCISVVAPSTVIHARHLCLKTRERFPRIKIIVGLWGASGGETESIKRLRDSGADEVVFSLAEAIVQIPRLAPIILEPMTPAPIPADDGERLAALMNLNLLDTDSEPVFDHITGKLVRAFEVPVALISLVDRDRLFFKSQSGLPDGLAISRESPRDTSVCGHAVASGEMMIVEDLARDRRFASNAWIREHKLRFYAGVPLRAVGGQMIGTLCLLDTRPRQFSKRDKHHLLEYANEVTEELARRTPAAG